MSTRRVAWAVLLLAAGCGREPRTHARPVDWYEANDGRLDERKTDTAVAGPETSGSDQVQPDLAAGEDARLTDAELIADDSAVTDVDAVEAPDFPPDLPPFDCGTYEPFDYSCDEKDPDSCPGGWCLAGLCIGPLIDQDRWDDCGDGSCEVCEPACPADCGQAPPVTGKKVYDSPDTISVWVHGFYNKSPAEMAEMVYGEEGGCGGVLGKLKEFGVERPCANTPEGQVAKDQIAKVEYYGGVPAPWLSPEDVAEIEQYPFSGEPLGLQRYALIVAKFIRHRLDVSGAQFVNLACHSMGCLILRHMIENNVENLAAESRLVRWFTSAGVIAGARLARLFDNPSVQAGAQALGLELSDFVIMNPDYVQDTTCWWDHKLYEGNNPLFAGMLIHHTAATDPKIQEALDIQLLDFNNPGDEPNDGIMYTFDEFLHKQSAQASFVLPDGTPMSATHTYFHADHMHMPDTDTAGLLAAAGLFHSRKVVLTLAKVELLKDRETHSPFDGENGQPPAEIAPELTVRYDPYVKNTFGKDVVVHQDLAAHRTAEMFTQAQGQVLLPGIVLFAAPVFDEMDAIQVKLDLLEMDWYPRFGVGEWVFDTDESLLKLNGPIQLADHDVLVESEYARVTIKVEVVKLY